MNDISNPLFIFISVFFLGLGLNLTPCVYPMLSITLSLFRGPGHEPRSHVFLKALAYVLGIASMYTGLGFIAAYTGSFFGNFLQNFWVQFGIGLLVIGLAFSMLGLYQFRIPEWLMPSHQGPRKRTLLSFYVSGLLVGVIAAPCMGPAVLTLLTFVSTQHNVLFGTAVFFVMALGLGLPYLILATYSGLLKKLPKSGPWLVWFERLLGFVLLVFGCFYIVMAFQWPVLRWIMPAAFVIGGIYLGWMEGSPKDPMAFLAVKRVLGTIILVLGIFFLIMPRQAFVWEKYHAGILEEAQTAGQPVILDFYADWCIACHELDQFTYPDPAVARALQPFRKVKVDTTSVEAKEIEDVVRRFGVYGVPTIIFLDERGQEIDDIRMTGYVPPEEFVQQLRSSPRVQRAGDGFP